jgi:NADH-quinone oxidoreductase subunit E
MPLHPPSAPGDWKSLPKELVARFDAQLAPFLLRYPPDRKEAAMIPALRIGQELFGHAGPAVQHLCADRLGTSAARAEEVATFYVMFHTHPTGRHIVEVCTNVSCCLAGADGMYRALRKRLGVGEDGTTPDGRITLREAECLGSCGTAPAVLVDEKEMVERVTAEKLARLVEGLP